ncbi:hypothetical protein [Noviherbaspirillum pedocola]|uniref:Uncharacterized protein n=1 Tax=Noviherbaspirillum pedocola TaxID=2801341 RepID=A0A934SWH9_9BURK|nr:hypothetical protein [Noviherbaspirillum pedocola]MBK4737865.1 hypothetical protein [Noviherbaspirillum pedocola]
MHSCNSDTEEKAATILGRILFEFSRLEMELGLCIVWIEGGALLEQLTRKHEYSTFNERLGFLRESVDQLLPAGSKGHTAYTGWLDQADTLRKLRNELIHGRWGVDTTVERVVNVIGMPTSPNQRSVGYSLEQLKQVLDSVNVLRNDLSTLRDRWPL